MPDIKPAPKESAPRPADLVDENSDQSFPASDPPGWSPLHAGEPCEARADEPGKAPGVQADPRL